MCRKLVDAGYDPARPLYAYRGDTLCLKVRSIGEGARLGCQDGGRFPGCGSPAHAFSSLTRRYPTRRWSFCTSVPAVTIVSLLAVWRRYACNIRIESSHFVMRKAVNWLVPQNLRRHVDSQILTFDIYSLTQPAAPPASGLIAAR